VSVGIALLASEIVAVLYGGRWEQAAAPLQVLAVFGCFRALWMLNGYTYNAIGKPQINFYMGLGRLVVMGALLYPLTTSYGIVGASLAVTVPMVIQFMVGIYLSLRLIGVPVATAVHPLAIAVGQGVVLVVVLIVAKLVVTSDPVLGLASLIFVGGATCLALNYRDLQAFLRTRVMSVAPTGEVR
jgi:O-antigen/teichoic acid export membrane protein